MRILCLQCAGCSSLEVRSYTLAAFVRPFVQLVAGCTLTEPRSYTAHPLAERT